MYGKNRIDLSNFKSKLENNYQSFWISIIFMGFITIAYLSSLFKMFGRKSFYHDISEYGFYQVFHDGVFLSLIFWLIPALIISVIWYSILKMKKRNDSLYNHVNSGTIVVEKAEIVGFEYYYNYDSDSHTKREGYYIIAMNGGNSYKSNLIAGAKLSDGYGKISVDKNYFQEINSLSDNYTILNENIKDFTVKDSKIFSKLSGIFNNQDLYNKNCENKKCPPSLIYDDKKWNLGDEVTIYIDPDDPKNYMMEF